MTDNTNALTMESVLEHSSWMRSFARSLVFDQSKVDDVVQEAWLAAIKTPANRIQNPKAWLSGVIRHTVFDFGKSESRRAKREQLAAKGEALPSTADLAEQVSMQRKIAGLVLELEEPYRSTVLLRFFEDLTPNEIAERQGVPPATVYSRLSRALEQMRERLDRDYGNRQDWCLALLPLAKLSKVASTSAISLTAIFGALFLVVSFFTWNFWIQSDSSNPIHLVNVSESSETSAQANTPSDSSISIPPHSTRELIASTAPPSPPQNTPQKHIIRGQVLDTSGAPVSRINVCWYGSGNKRNETRTVTFQTGITVISHEDDCLTEAVSDDLGHFQFEFVNPPVSEKGGAESRGEDWLRVADGWFLNESGEREYVLVVAKSRELFGSVVDEQGSPIADAEVQSSLRFEELRSFPLLLDKLNTQDRLLEMNRSDGYGRFQLKYVPDVSEVRVVTKHPDYRQDQRNIPNSPSAELSIVLLSRQPQKPLQNLIRGRVVDANGIGLADVTVGMHVEKTKTDSTGAFAFEAQAGFEDDEALYAVRADYQPVRIENYGKVVRESSKSLEPVLICLKEKALSISGRVVDAAGNPLSGFEVDIFEPSLFSPSVLGSDFLSEFAMRGSWQRMTTQKSGQFWILGLANRSYRLLAWDEKSLLAIKSPPISAGSQNVQIVIPADSVREKIRGQVLSAAGIPLPGVEVSLGLNTYEVTREGGSVSNTITREGTFTNLEGRFELNNVPRYEVYLQFNGKAIAEKRTTIPVESDGQDLRFNLPVKCRLILQDSFPVGEESQETFSILDEQERRIQIRNASSPDVWGSFNVGSRADVNFSIYEVDETARALVFYKEEKVLRRIPLQLQIGKVNRVHF